MRSNRIVIGVICLIVSFFVVRHCVQAGVSVVALVSSSALYPLLRVQQLVVEPVAGFFEQRATINQLQDHIKKIHILNEALLAENVAFKAMQSYEYQTQQLRSFNNRYALSRGCIAQVMVRHFSPTNQFFLVNAGSSFGIKKDMVAIYCNTIVGKVIEVYPWYCKVCLVTDADCKIAVGCGPKGASGIHEGIYDAGQTAVAYVSHLESVSVGDMVLSSGEGLVFPKGFGLGTITAADKGELFYTIVVEPALNLQKLSYCTLIAKEDIE